MFDPMSDDIYAEIASDPIIREHLLEDIDLEMGVFAEKHGPTIVDHYASQYPIEPAYANDIASALWWHLHPDRELPPAVKDESNEPVLGPFGTDGTHPTNFWPM